MTSSLKSLDVQLARLRELFPEFRGVVFLSLADCRPLPPNAEGSLVIPKWEVLASTYGGAVQKVFDRLTETRGGRFLNWANNGGGPWQGRLRLHERTAAMLNQLADRQKGGDAVVMQAQFGLYHQRKTVDEARKMFAANEFGLGAFAVGIMLLTHPERLRYSDDPGIVCPGDEYDGWCGEAGMLASEAMDVPPFYDAGEFSYYKREGVEGCLMFGVKPISDLYHEGDSGCASAFV